MSTFIPFPPTQEQYDEWRAVMDARAEDPDEPWHHAETNDCVNALALALDLWANYPHKRAVLEMRAPLIIEDAGTRYGTFISAGKLGELVGLVPAEAQLRMMNILSHATGDPPA